LGKTRGRGGLKRRGDGGGLRTTTTNTKLRKKIARRKKPKTKHRSVAGHKEKHEREMLKGKSAV